MLERLWGKGNSPPLLVGMEVGAATMEKSMEAPQGTKTRSTIFFSSPTLRHISTKIELNKIHAPSVHIYLCEHVGAGELPRSPVRLVLGLGAGAPAAGVS